MAASKLKKGSKLVCVPCGREVVVSSAGVARTTIWCCSRPMKAGKAAAKKTVKKSAKKTVAKKKAGSKKKK